ncbi:alpha/beta hydrolase [Betaproteobacteria bacterium GR16-43]|nr:alpha/beta hydrolase [Betaproteobacteria bacterium GR16-43]
MKNKNSSELRAPGPMLLALEGRAFWEVGATLATLPWLRRAASGDGHPVIVYPGLVATDMSTLPLRMFLRQRGFDAHGWELKRNYGPREGVLDESIERVLSLRKSTGRRVSLVGWSLGGVYAREIAKRLPREVRCVVTMGSPFTGSPKATNAWRIYELASGHKLDDPEVLEEVRAAPPVPTTSIFSRTDGIVAWQCSFQAPGGQTENIEVAASHVGMGLNPAAWYAVADRLSQREGRWKPFHRRGWREWVFADPQRA